MHQDSNTARGNKFADKIFARVSELAQAGGLTTSAEMCKTYREKGYSSPRRKVDIKLDVTVEVWPLNASRWSLLWAFECKDHSSRIGDSHLSKFFTQLEEVAPCNKKGILVTKSTFTENALIYARETGMGLIRILPDDQVDYVMHQKLTALGPDEGEDECTSDIPFLSPEFRGKNNRFYARTGDKVVHSMQDLLAEMLKIR